MSLFLGGELNEIISSKTLWWAYWIVGTYFIEPLLLLYIISQPKSGFFFFGHQSDQKNIDINH